MKRVEKTVCILLLILTAVYLCIFAYLNLACYLDNVDSDIAGEALLAREIAEQHTLTPDDWICSTRRYVVGVPAIAAPFYAITGRMDLGMGIACLLLGVILIVLMYYALRKAGLSRIASLSSVLMLLALPVNGIKNEGQIVPYVSICLFLFADYYVLFFISLFLNLIFYMHLRGLADIPVLKKGKKIAGLPVSSLIVWAVLLIYLAAISFGSEHGLLFVVAPFIAFEAVRLFAESGMMKKPLPRGSLHPAIFVLSVAGSFALTRLYRGTKTYLVFMNGPREFTERFLITVPSAILEGFGISGNAVLGNTDSLLQLMMYAFLVLVIISLVIIFKKKTGKDIDAAYEKYVLLAGIPFTGVLIAWFTASATSAEPAQNYFIAAWFAAVIAVGCLIDRLTAEKSYFAYVILFAIAVFALINIGHTYKDAIDSEDNLKSYKEVISQMEENGFEYGYAEFWDAGRITLLSEGRVTMGHTYHISELEMYWWLTDRRWYPPNLPTRMHTAYVVRTESEEAFLAQFDDPSCVYRIYENDRFVLYGSETNFVSMP